ncbi:helix-turn-helix domain-containing protein [Glycomyces terrestris]|uniref:XRE family transcriptional regulator n=1 Tax=Glycomyces terrestris TaxID=2493553 RepID=A0A426USM0_9ACTN|nr:XRE family transcriptional regulator [Glycomyces terrestris]
MPRFEKPIDSEHQQVAEFAQELRELRHRAGTPSYRRLAVTTGYSPSTLAKAASGSRMPTLPVVLAYVRACGGNIRRWRFRWHELNAHLNSLSRQVGSGRTAGPVEQSDVADRAAAAAAVAAELTTLITEVRRAAAASRPPSAQSATKRRRNRMRIPGSSRHLAETINSAHGPAGTVSHVRVARTLAGDPRHALDELLVHAIVGACHELCGFPYTPKDRLRWAGKLSALRREFQADLEESERPR